MSTKKVCRTMEECRELYAALPAEKKLRGIELLRDELSEHEPEFIAKANKLIALHGKEGWFWHIYDEHTSQLSEDAKARGLAALYNPHFMFGMGVRNFLRNNNCDEDFFDIGNLDDIYIELLTEAVQDGQTLDTR